MTDAAVARALAGTLQVISYHLRSLPPDRRSEVEAALDQIDKQYHALSARLAQAEQKVVLAEDVLQETATRLGQAERQRDDAMQGLFDCYVITGSDTDGDKKWHTPPAEAARYTVAAVQELRRDYDEAVEGQHHDLRQEVKEREQAEARLREYEEALTVIATGGYGDASIKARIALAKDTDG